MTEASSDLKDRVDELSRQVVDTRNQMIKNTNAVGNLVAEVRDISRIHEQQRRRMLVNSVGAYSLFLLLVSAASYLLYQAKVEGLALEKNAVRRQHAATQTKLDQLRAEARKRRETETLAMEFYQLIRRNQMGKALKRYTEIARLPLTRVEHALFERWVNNRKASLAYSAYAAGMRAVNEKNWKRTVLQFKRSLDYLPNPPHAASLHYYRGIALSRLGNYQQAASALEKSRDLKAERLVSRQLHYHLAGIYELLGRREQARAAYRLFVQRQPKGHFARVARQRLKILGKKKK
jgi:tetratricopeptide (TPR) repeat protein